MKRQKIRSQRRVPGETRIPTSSSLLKVLREKVENDAARYHVSKSYVVATALAAVYGVEIEDFHTRPEKLRVVRGGRR